MLTSFLKMANVTGNACPRPAAATSNGVFQGENPLHSSLPLVILQICLVVVITRSLAFLLKPLRQPRVIAEIIVSSSPFSAISLAKITVRKGGILLGPSALGRSKAFLHTVFPPSSLTVLDTLANLGLLFFLFLVGLELDPKSLRRTGKRAFGIAVAGISLPFVLGIGTSAVLRHTISKDVQGAPFLLFGGVALSITAFPVLARILAELKLLTTDVGRMAMSAAAVNDVAAWILLALAIALSGSSQSALVSLWVLLCGVAFVLFCTFLVQPILAWIARRTPEGEPVGEIYVCATLAAVLAAGFVTDTIGIHALFGAFIIGVLVPKDGPFAGALVEKVEDLVSGLFLPLYFVSSGLKTNVATIQGARSWGLLVLVILTACLGKIAGTVGVSMACRMPFREALALGFLMNTKGLVELIVLNIGKDRKVLNDQTFAVFVLMALFTTFITTPLVTALYKPARKSRTIYKHRTIERKDSGTQLRILACFHSSRNIPTIINLIEASRGTNRGEGLCVYAMHLMELSERPSAILMVHKARKNGLPFWNKTPRSGYDQVVVAFEAFERLSNVSIRPMTAISALSDIHEDICASAERKEAAIIILPLHKDQRLDGALEVTRHEFRSVNRKVLEHAPCSVGILVDRGLGGTTHVSASDVSSSITVLFFGGQDDREALTYATRIAEHPGIRLTVLRLIESRNGFDGVSVAIDMNGSSTAEGRLVDEKVLNEFRNKTQNDPAIMFEEREVSSSDETVAAIQTVSRSDLILVGRRPEGAAAAAPMAERNECPELGPVGGLLTSPSFLTTASVLVVQQYSGQSRMELSPADSEEPPEVQMADESSLRLSRASSLTLTSCSYSTDNHHSSSLDSSN
ncbi:cation/H(+) antiporter 18 [Cocos nucifera]|uniref:Cation/H(+) antiporter 18 n=1 Tax=Cocos nucifera TaxID=13894 RepID=A0A8K0IAU4_COCNU|nr:cation/H(+) antiporter 18 [Cocos nucifera]